jgi:hypothetical protein
MPKFMNKHNPVPRNIGKGAAIFSLSKPFLPEPIPFLPEPIPFLPEPIPLLPEPMPVETP